jgi:hypothetical protein
VRSGVEIQHVGLVFDFVDFHLILCVQEMVGLYSHHVDFHLILCVQEMVDLYSLQRHFMVIMHMYRYRFPHITILASASVFVHSIFFRQHLFYIVWGRVFEAPSTPLTMADGFSFEPWTL